MNSDKTKAKAKSNAYILLRSRPRSESELRQRLKLKGYKEDIVALIIEDLRRTGDIDDEKFARFWVESRMHLNPAGDIVLRKELREKGVKDIIIEATLARKAEQYDEYEVAFNMAQDKFERLKRLDGRKAVKRLYDFLIRRGFKYETVRDIVEKLLGKGNEDG